MEGFLDVVLNIPSCPQMVMRAPNHLFIARQLHERGGIKHYEPDSLACALACMTVKKGAFYDVGANIGVFSFVVAGSLQRQTYAFEPTPEIADVMEEFVNRYGLPVAVHRLALSDRSGVARFYLSNRSDASNSMNRKFRLGSPAIEVPTATLDSLAVDPPALLKIDVETFEPQVIAGAMETIRTHRPYIICEVLRPYIAERINALMDGLGYEVCQISSLPTWRSHPRIPAQGVSAGDERNWLFSPVKLESPFFIELDAQRSCLART